MSKGLRVLTLALAIVSVVSYAMLIGLLTSAAYAFLFVGVVSSVCLTAVVITVNKHDDRGT